MAVTLALEWIGLNYDRRKAFYEKKFRRGMLPASDMKKLFGPSRKPWVRDLDSNSFLRGQVTYKNADKKGERGVTIYFHLQEGGRYEVHHWTSWEECQRYKCIIKDNRICRKNT